MSSKKKLLNRLTTIPKDFTWTEMVTLCRSLGFKEVRGSGSRVKFFHKELDCVICVHKPHPSKIVKQYVLIQLLSLFEEKD